MSPPWRRDRFPATPDAHYDSDIELLQTDVMRFMALLGFVLMGIFALVQSLPTAVPDLKPALKRKKALEHDIQTLLAEVRVQRQALDRVRARVKQTLSLRQQLSAETDKNTTVLKRTLEKVRASNADLARNQQALKDVQAQLNQRKQSLSTLQNTLASRRSELERVRSRVGQLEQSAVLAQQLRQKELDKIRAEQQAAKAAARRRQEARAAKREKALAERRAARRKKALAERRAAAKAESKRKEKAHSISPPASRDRAKPRAAPRTGFTLKFNSANAFNQMLAGQSIQFYALQKSNAWQAHLAAGRARFESTAPPHSYYKMAPQTVPAKYKRAIQQSATSHTGAIVWGVVLPPALIKKIKQTITGQKSGDIVIHSDGSIRLQNATPSS